MISSAVSSFTAPSAVRLSLIRFAPDYSAYTWLAWSWRVPGTLVGRPMEGDVAFADDLSRFGGLAFPAAVGGVWAMTAPIFLSGHASTRGGFAGDGGGGDDHV